MNQLTRLSAVFIGTGALFLTGCVGTGPNTQQGAVTGGALGALAGAVIGNNSGSGNAASGALIGAAVGALAGGTMGNAVDHERGTLHGSYNQAYANRVETYSSAPPPPPRAPAVREVVMAPPAVEAVWIPGYWRYHPRGYVWEPGRWEIPPPHARTYVTGHWEQRGDRTFWVDGYWN
jgi:hypothetical protein